MAGDVLEFVYFQLILALSSFLSIYVSAIHQQSRPIAHFDCIDVEAAVFLQYKWTRKSQWIIDGADYG